MLEMVLSVIMNLLAQPWITQAIAFIIGLAFPQPHLFAKFWDYVMRTRQKMDKLEELIDTMDAVLKANGVIPANTPKISPEQIKSMMNGKQSAEEVINEQKNKIALLDK